MAPLLSMPNPLACGDEGRARSEDLSPHRSAAATAASNAANPKGSGTIPPKNKRAYSKNMEAQKQLWNLEQEVIAVLVRVDADPPMDTSVIGDNPWGFHLVRDNHKDVFSFSSTPELYGGVDVSFPIVASTTDQPQNHNTTSNSSSRDAQSQGNDGDDVDRDDQAVAVYVVVNRRTMQVVYQDHVVFDLEIPYIPTYLAFREIAPLELLVQRQIQTRPDVTPQAILVDGNGILHPRHAGIACFLGTRTDIPTIGIGKNLFYEGGWTRELVDVRLDSLIQKVHQSLKTHPLLAAQLSRYRGLLVEKKQVHIAGKAAATTPLQDVEMASGDEQEATNKNTFNRKQALQDLAPYCNGLAVPLAAKATKDADTKDLAKSADDDEDDDNRFPVLGCALVGHGGQIAATSNSQPHAGSSKPIFVSVGHKISMQEAVQVAASLSAARIPEPVRQADLYGRELMRQRAAAVVTSRGFGGTNCN